MNFNVNLRAIGTGMRIMLVLAGALLSSVAAAATVTLHALFKDKAIVMIDGARRVLARGEVSPEGVKLLTTDTATESAEFEIDGRRLTLTLGAVIAPFTSGPRASVMLWAGSGGHFYADGAINGVAVRFLVDTGATSIALNSREAARLGIEYKKVGQPGLASTAGGTVRVYAMKLNTVQVGDITLHNVDAGVVEGSYPTEILLGMSFLGQLDIKHNGEQMELTPRF